MPSPSDVEETLARSGETSNDPVRYNAIAASWRGPLPPPSSLREYNQVFPGCAERIVAMAEAESLHRREEEKGERLDRHAVIQSEISTQRIGMWMAFALSMLVIALSAFLLYTGHLAWGIGLVGVELVSLVSLFLYGKKRDTDLLRADSVSEQQNLPFPE